MQQKELLESEEYLLNSKEELVCKLIKGTDSYYYYKFIQILIDSKFSLSVEEQKQLQDYAKFTTPKAKDIKIRHLFLQYDQFHDAGNELESKIVLDEINKEILSIQFDHPKPASAQLGQQDRQIISNLDESKLDVELLIEQAYSSLDLFQQINSMYYHLLDLQKLKSSALDIKDHYLDNVGLELSCTQNVCEFLKDYFEEKREADSYSSFEFDTILFRKLSLEQIEQMGKLVPHLNTKTQYVEELFIKKFRQYLKPASKHDDQNLRKVRLIEMYRWALSCSQQTLADQILFEILQITLETNQYDFELFMTYIEHPMNLYPNISEERQKALSKNQYQQDDWHAYHGFDTHRWSTDFITKYLECYFEKNKNLQIFEPYFIKTYLINIMNLVALHKGEQISDINKYFTQSALKQLNSKRFINICSYNKKHFNVGYNFNFNFSETVTLQVELKNIPNLQVKVFNICAEKYYLKTHQEISDSINLDGLVASEQSYFTYTEPPIVKSLKQFTFETVQEKGVYIVEFIGNGLTSRAIIIQGSLKFIMKLTVAGHVFSILDENQQLCGGIRTGIWINNRFYKTNDDKEIIVPFVSYQTEYQCILVHEQLAFQEKIVLYKEYYEFLCSYVYSHESMLMNSKAVVLIQPRLYVNKIPVSLKLLLKPLIIVNTINEDGIPDTVNFDKIEFKQDEEVEIQFTIGAKLKSINIKVNAQVQYLNNESKTLQSQHDIILDNFVDNKMFCNQFLRLTTDHGYQILVLGKNGEPKSGLDIDLAFKLDGFRQTTKSTLTTDQHGRITLGQLKYVTSIKSEVQSVGDQTAKPQQWSIKNNFKTNYPKQILLVEGDEYKLPFSQKSESKIFLHEVHRDQTRDSRSMIRNVSNHLKFVDNNFVIISGLKVGTYELQIPLRRVCVQIDVLDGQHLKNRNLIVTKDFLYDIKNQLNTLVLLDVQQTTTGQFSEIKAKYMSDNPKSTRVHAIAVQFMPTYKIDYLVQQIQGNIHNDKKQQISLDYTLNQYFNNKKLSLEQKYVLDRKKQERYVGSTLAKPQILLSRQFIMETDQDEEIDDDEDDMDEFNRETANQRQMQTYGRGQYEEQKFRGRNMFNDDEDNDISFNNLTVNTFLNFLQHAATVVSNKKLDDSGCVTFQIPSQQYVTVFLIATNNFNTVMEVISLQDSKELLITKDLTQKSSTDDDKFYSIFRNVEIIEKGACIRFADSSSTEYQIVDSMEKLFTLMIQLRKCNGYDGEQENGFEYWNFLKHWEGLDVDKKHNLYDKHQCDEINLFLFFRDRAYFETYVKDYIKNKIEISFMDDFLSKNRLNLMNHCKVQNISRLNALEKVLLVVYLAEISDVQSDEILAQEITQYLDQLNKSKSVDQKLYDRYFDTILAAKVKEVVDEDPFANGIVHMAAVGHFDKNDYEYEEDDDYESPYDYENKYENKQKQVESPRNMSRGSVGGSEEGFERCCQDESGLEGGQVSGEEKYLEVRTRFLSEFKNTEKTKEYCEKHYHNTKHLYSNENLVTLNDFWVDVAKHSITQGVMKKSLLSSKFIYCNQNHSEMIAVLALMALPVTSPSHEYSSHEGKGLQIQASSTSIIFVKGIKESKSDLRADILIAQKFFIPAETNYYTQQNDLSKIEQDLSQYTINKVYGSQVVVTNCSAVRSEFQVLIEVPQGSIPVQSMNYTQNHNMTLEEYTTTKIEFFFYFPQAGQYTIQPANIARFGTVIAVAQNSTFNVVKELTISKLETMDDILSKGSKLDILNFISTNNIFSSNIFKFQDIYYLLKDKQFYLDLLEVLRKKHAFDYTTWTFSFYHADHQSLQEFFQCQNINYTLSKTFKYFKCSLFEHTAIRFLEYYPLVSQRVHQLSQDSSNILNVQFKEQYSTFLLYMVEKSKPCLKDQLVFLYYLLLQERIIEAIKVYQSIDQTLLLDSGEVRLQFDYFTAYIDFYIGFPNFIQARQVCQKYLDYPVIHWRNLFYEIINQLTEYDGLEIIQQKEEIKKKDIIETINQTLELTLEDRRLVLNHYNILECDIQIYKIDLEVLFSLNPFISQANQAFAYVQPNNTFTVQLSKTNRTIVDIPEQFKNDNIFIQGTSGDISVQTTYFSNTLDVKVMENYGQVVVRDQKGKCLSKIYVKTFAQEIGGKVVFYKDGYTDLTGRFDYATLDPKSLEKVEKFSIFIMSDELGSVIKEIKAPGNVGKYVEEVNLISKQWESRRQNAILRSKQALKSNQKFYGQRKDSQ